MLRLLTSKKKKKQNNENPDTNKKETCWLLRIVEGRRKQQRFSVSRYKLNFLLWEKRKEHDFSPFLDNFSELKQATRQIKNHPLKKKKKPLRKRSSFLFHLFFFFCLQTTTKKMSDHEEDFHPHIEEIEEGGSSSQSGFPFTFLPLPFPSLNFIFSLLPLFSLFSPLPLTPSLLS